MWPNSLDRKLAFLDGDDPATRASKIRAFEVIFLLVLLVEYWARAIPKWELLAPSYSASLAAASLLCLAGLYVPLRRLAFAGLAVTHAWVIWNEFPAAGNHAYLEGLLCLLGAGLDVREEEEQVLYLRSVRWLVCLIFFYSGLQKMVHGYWFQGQYLAFSLWIDSFRTVLRPLIPAPEFDRLIAYTRQVGDGPYLVDSAPFVVLSNAVYLIEMALAPLLLVRRTRAMAVVLAILVVLAIEAGARELFFGLLFINAILLFVRTDLNRRLIGVFVLVLGCLGLSRVGVLPEMTFY